LDLTHFWVDGKTKCGEVSMVRNFVLAKRMDNLAKKIVDPDTERLIHLDFESFSAEEKILIRKVDEMAEKYYQTGSGELLVENSDLIAKNLEILLNRVRDLYCYVVSTLLGYDQPKEVVEYFVRLHFCNFEADLTECLANVVKWSDKDREAFILDLRKNGAILFRIPREFGHNEGKEFIDLNNSKDLESV
jgi:hypothetical protein